MLDQEFCNKLEIEISKAFILFEQFDTKGFWCDGILLPGNPKNISKKYINDNRQVYLTIFTGKSGQEKFELILKLGSISLSKYSRDLSIEDCIPNSDANDWFAIDVLNKRIIIKLN